MLQVGEDHQLLNESFVAELSNRLRSETSPKEYIGPSFGAIVASGINGAKPHYQWEPGKEAAINNSAVMYIDSGGQYFGMWLIIRSVCRSWNFVNEFVSML